MEKWMIYGSGYTARLIAEEAVRRGYSPIIAGRNSAKTKQIANQLGLEWKTVSLEDSLAVQDAFESVGLVLNTAGPFIDTCAIIMDACLATKTHYLDVSNEIEVFHIAESRHAAALQAGITIFPGVGFGTLASNFLARIALEQIQNPISLEIAIAPFVATKSVGATKSAINAIANNNYVVENGKLQHIPLGSRGREIQFSDKTRNVLPVSSGDLEAARLAFELPNIVVYWPSPFPSTLSRPLLPMIQKSLSAEWVRERVGTIVEKMNSADQHSPINNADGRSQLWVHAQGAQGDFVDMWMETGEGYAFTASASLNMIEATLSNSCAGISTASMFDASYISQIPQVKTSGIFK